MNRQQDRLYRVSWGFYSIKTLQHMPCSLSVGRKIHFLGQRGGVEGTGSRSVQGFMGRRRGSYFWAFTEINLGGQKNSNWKHLASWISGIGIRYFKGTHTILCNASTTLSPFKRHFLWRGGGATLKPPNSEQQTNFFSSSLFSIRFEKCDYAEF